MLVRRVFKERLLYLKVKVSNSFIQNLFDSGQIEITKLKKMIKLSREREGCQALVTWKGGRVENHGKEMKMWMEKGLFQSGSHRLCEKWIRNKPIMERKKG